MKWPHITWTSFFLSSTEYCTPRPCFMSLAKSPVCGSQSKLILRVSGDGTQFSSVVLGWVMVMLVMLRDSLMLTEAF